MGEKAILAPSLSWYLGPVPHSCTPSYVADMAKYSHFERGEWLLSSMQELLRCELCLHNPVVTKTTYIALTWALDKSGLKLELFCFTCITTKPC